MGESTLREALALTSQAGSPAGSLREASSGAAQGPPRPFKPPRRPLVPLPVSRVYADSGGTGLAVQWSQGQGEVPSRQGRRAECPPAQASPGHVPSTYARQEHGDCKGLKEPAAVFSQMEGSAMAFVSD